MDRTVNGLIGAYEREMEASGYKATGEQKVLGKDDFLKLLVTQLEHQDPLNPMDDKEFIAQLAQFSSLEQMNNISEGINKLVQSNNTSQMLGAVGFIGKEVTAKGDSLSKEDDKVSTVYYSLNDVAKNMYVNVFDQFGNIIYSTNLGARQAGDYEFHWDGKDFTGKDAPNGVYKVTFAAEGIHGQPVLVDTQVSGKVAGVQNTTTGTVLRLEDGRVVNFNNIKEVVNSDH
ncbi:flagellar basal-body rod modification protein FlgD [Desulfonauticus submarinus]|uniref:Basal-body rod modification protein FlgD n=1 Tax=Desulfonauticus submarinus TaxID=206665 RepID=A0A1H0CQH3_9BACT|nr:flagellar hook assembly protein FlgD [Desulfonauticus submarinus]SDN60083.1 flagellar basal-body rod modification protein FlgD [Desulfonauticus submarinus]